MRARKTAFLRIIFTSNQTPFLGVLSSRSIERYRGNDKNGYICFAVYFDSVKVIFWLTPKLRRTLHFWNRIIGSDNAHFFACVRLFLHASAKVSCVGFIIWSPSGRCVVCFSFDQPIVASDSRLSYACILLFPTGTQYPAGSPKP